MTKRRTPQFFKQATSFILKIITLKNEFNPNSDQFFGTRMEDARNLGSHSNKPK